MMRGNARLTYTSIASRVLAIASKNAAVICQYATAWGDSPELPSPWQVCAKATALVLAAASDFMICNTTVSSSARVASENSAAGTLGKSTAAQRHCNAHKSAG